MILWLINRFLQLEPLISTWKRKKFITEEKLEFFSNYLYVCAFTRRYPHMGTVTQKIRSSAHLWLDLIYLCSPHGHKRAGSAQPLHFSATWLRGVLGVALIQHFLDKRFNRTVMASSFPVPVLAMGFCFLRGSNFTSWKGVDSSSVLSEEVCNNFLWSLIFFPPSFLLSSKGLKEHP